MGHEAREQVAGWLQHHVLSIALVFDQPGHRGDEITQAGHRHRRSFPDGTHANDYRKLAMIERKYFHNGPRWES